MKKLQFSGATRSKGEGEIILLQLQRSAPNSHVSHEIRRADYLRLSERKSAAASRIGRRWTEAPNAGAAPSRGRELQVIIAMDVDGHELFLNFSRS